MPVEPRTDMSDLRNIRIHPDFWYPVARSTDLARRMLRTTVQCGLWPAANVRMPRTICALTTLRQLSADNDALKRLASPRYPHT